MALFFLSEVTLIYKKLEVKDGYFVVVDNVPVNTEKITLEEAIALVKQIEEQNYKEETSE